MTASSFMHGWMTFIGSLTSIALILTAFGLLLGIVKPADALKHVGAILGIVIVLMLIPAVLANIWSGMSLWQRIALVAIVIGVWQWQQPPPESRKRREK